MSEQEFKTKLTDDSGSHDVTLKMEDYAEAAELKISLPQLLANKYDVGNAAENGTPFTQMLANAGMFTNYNHELGIKPPSMDQVLNGSVKTNMGAISRPDGQNALSPSGRLLFPALILEMVESELRRDDRVYSGVFNSMVGTTVSINTPRYDQPVINMTGPRTSKSQPIAQLSEPDRMLSITVSDRSFRMPVKSIGLEISKEAQAASTLDLVGIAVREQALEERADMVDQSISDMILGNADMGPDSQAALGVTAGTTYDALMTGGVVTHKGWVKFLRTLWKYRSIDWVMTDIDGFLAIEGRTGRPIVTEDAGNDARINTIPTIANAGLPNLVNVFVVEDATVLGGAGRFVGIDSSKAIRRVIYTGADYSAIEEFVMRKSTSFRFDWSERHERIGFDNAWEVVDFS
jgi:hypothetical protein